MWERLPWCARWCAGTRLLGDRHPTVAAGAKWGLRRRWRGALDSCLIVVLFPSDSCSPGANDIGGTAPKPLRGHGPGLDTGCVVWLFQCFPCPETWGRDPCPPGPAPRGSRLLSPERPRGNCCQDGVNYPSPAAGNPYPLEVRGALHQESQPTAVTQPRRGTLTPRTESRRWLKPVPERKVASCEHFGRSDAKTLAPAPPGAGY